ncbi:endo alpha-1,4 polygalactosaminidase [Deinococcus hopiensis]|uniref:endo alpha-1,4 polygalactosaminidase n=1 Tax=Deinococcus hopiensis TaxID=309885 RepID=UPI003CCB8281
MCPLAAAGFSCGNRAVHARDLLSDSVHGPAPLRLRCATSPREPWKTGGRGHPQWHGERWLDIRRLDLLAPPVRAEQDRCRALGFGGVDPGNLDGYGVNPGFPGRTRCATPTG